MTAAADPPPIGPQNRKRPILRPDYDPRAPAPLPWPMEHLQRVVWLCLGVVVRGWAFAVCVRAVWIAAGGSPGSISARTLATLGSFALLALWWADTAGREDDARDNRLLPPREGTLRARWRSFATHLVGDVLVLVAAAALAIYSLQR